ncbi:MAG: 16S rRNA (cytosine(967)-C(5))-methyltransferase RsmB [Clostridiales bacterium]|nr:16S rRNA (cytosine(967)-C(5))-methyltransferase RsmB [Clostridiales bacterium]
MNKEIRQAYTILRKVYENGAYAGIELNKTIQREHSTSNTKLVTKIVYGVIEKDISLEYIINQYVKKSPDKLAVLLLKIGTYIMYYLNSIPDFACVNELVNIAKAVMPKYVAGFINGTLKNIAKRNATMPSKDKDYLLYLSVKYSYPIWAIEELINDHDTDFVENFLNCELTTLTHIRVLEDKMTIEDFIAKLDENKVKHIKSAYKNTMYVEYSELLNIPNISKCYVVQGLPSIITANNVRRDAKRVLDLCAAPGGKSVLIAQNNPDAQVVSCDVSDMRVDLINKYAHTYDIDNITTIINDATIYRKDWENSFDVVLCDVPCSNLGITNKKPDVLLNRTKDSIKELSNIQLQILENGAKYVKSGGELIYSTCSILKAENEKIVGIFLKNNKNYKIIDVETNGVETEVYHKLRTFYPHISGCEGFFIGRLRRE